MNIIKIILCFNKKISEQEICVILQENGNKKEERQNKFIYLFIFKGDLHALINK